MATVMWDEALPLPITHQTCPLVAKLERFAMLSARDIAVLEGLCSDPQKVPSHEVLIDEGSRLATIAIIVRGLAVRYKCLPNGRRQILGYLASGDISDPYCADFEPIDHSIELLCESWVATVPCTRLVTVMRDHSQVERAILMAAMAEQAILREWLANIGQRGAYEKLGHFFCEMAIRLATAGQANCDGSIELPLSQGMLADTTGLTHVHINRILKRLRFEGLVLLNRRRIVIPSLDRLAAAVEFEREYLDAPPIRY